MKISIKLIGCMLYISNFIGMMIIIILSFLDNKIYSDYSNQFIGFLYMNYFDKIFKSFIILQIIGVILIIIPDIYEKIKKIF